MSLPMPKFFGSRTNRGSVGSLTVFAAIFALMAAGTAATFFFGGCFITREERNVSESCFDVETTTTKRWVYDDETRERFFPPF